MKRKTLVNISLAIVLFCCSLMLVACGNKEKAQENTLQVSKIYQNYEGHIVADISGYAMNQIPHLYFNVNDGAWLSLYNVLVGGTENTPTTFLLVDYENQVFENGEIYSEDGYSICGVPGLAGRELAFNFKIGEFNESGNIYLESPQLTNAVNYTPKPLADRNSADDEVIQRYESKRSEDAANPFAVRLSGSLDAETLLTLGATPVYENGQIVNYNYVQYMAYVTENKLFIAKVVINVAQSTYELQPISTAKFAVSSALNFPYWDVKNALVWKNADVQGVSIENETSFISGISKLVNVFVVLEETTAHCNTLLNTVALRVVIEQLD